MSKPWSRRRPRRLGKLKSGRYRSIGFNVIEIGTFREHESACVEDVLTKLIGSIVTIDFPFLTSALDEAKIVTIGSAKDQLCISLEY